MKKNNIIKLVFCLIIISVKVNGQGFTETGSVTGTTANSAITVHGVVYVGKGVGGASTSTAVGNGALATSSTSADNTAIGYNSQNAWTGASGNNTSVGSNTLGSNTGGTNNAAFGYGAGRLITSSNNALFGSGAGYNATTASGISSFGQNAMLTLSTGDGNAAFGQNALYYLNGYANNTALGTSAMRYWATGSHNTAIGYQALTSFHVSNVPQGSGSYNSAVGHLAQGNLTSGDYNSSIGTNSLLNLSNGSYNTACGASALSGMVKGSYNVAIGVSALTGLTNTTTASTNNVAIGLSAQVPAPDVTAFATNQLSIQNAILGVNMPASASIGNGNIGIAVVPQIVGTRFSKLHVGGSGANAPSLQLDNVLSATNTTGKYLYLDGDKMVMQDNLPGSVSYCTTVGTVPVTNGTNGDMTCGQITDDLTNSVGIHYSGSFGYTYPASIWYEGPTQPNPTGTHRLAVDGTVKALGYYASSDERYKKDIKTIHDALKKIKRLRGVSYNWNQKEFPKVSFTSVPQLGFIAQEVDKVIPEAIIADKEGFLSMNYTTIIPLLTEGIKEQQSQIEKLELKIAEQDASISELKNKINQLIPGNVIVKDDNFHIAPNPVTATSIVSYRFDPVITNAVFIVYDLQGKMLRKYNVDANAKEGKIQISSKDFGNGMYILSLVSNNNEIESKHFIISE